MSDVQLALYKGKGLPGNAVVRRWTRSIYSHCEIALPDFLGDAHLGTLCMSSSLMDGGVRAKRIVLDPAKWDVIDCPWVDVNRVWEHFAATEGERYGLRELFASQFFAAGRDEPRASFCSSWCAGAFGLPHPWIYNPAALGALARHLTERHLAEHRA